MDKSFKLRVQKFWKAFSEEESQIREMMDNKADGQTLLNFVDSILQIAFTRVYFEMGINNDGKYELILTPEGDQPRLLQLYYWQQYAPAQLSEKWNFYSSKPAQPARSWTMNMHGIDIGAEDIIIYTEVDEQRHKINLEIYSPKLMALDENPRFSMLFIFIDQFIGELYTMEFIGYVDFTDHEQNKESVKISSLKEYIEKTAADNQWTIIENPYEIFKGYQMNPTENENWALREDVVSGYTSCSSILNAYYNNDSRIVDDLKEDGVTFGFVFINNVNIPREDIVNFRAEIEDKIMAQVQSSGIAYSLGGASGFHFSYLDFIIFDFEVFINITKKIIAQYKSEEAGYSDFVRNFTPVIF